MYGRLLLFYLLLRVEDVGEGGLADLDGQGEVGGDQREDGGEGEGRDQLVKKRQASQQ